MSRPENREILLGVKRNAPPSPEQMAEDVTRVIRYSSKEDYAVWAKEAWSDAIRYLDRLMKDDLTDRQVDFYRGSLCATMEILRISYKARFMKDDTLNAEERQKAIHGAR